jgi:hypothetical protein
MVASTSAAEDNPGNALKTSDHGPEDSAPHADAPQPRLLPISRFNSTSVTPNPTISLAPIPSKFLS